MYMYIYIVKIVYKEICISIFTLSLHCWRDMTVLQLSHFRVYKKLRRACVLSIHISTLLWYKHN